MKWTHAIALIMLAGGLVACQKPKQTQPDRPPQASAPAELPTTGGVDTEPVSRAPIGGAGQQQQALAALQARNIVYFDFDSSEVRAEDLDILAAHAGYLVKYPNAMLRLEGHTDVRGSREYNIGLGERRAQTVRRALMLQGVADAQLTTVSYGEERTAADGDDDAAHAQNRRVELVHVQ